MFIPFSIPRSLMETKSSRIFLGVPVPDPTRREIESWLETAFKSGVPGKPVRPEKWHITLVFVGEVEPSRLPSLTDGVSAFSPPAPFALSLNRLGCFPDPTRARVLWLGPEPSEPLDDLAGGLRDLIRHLHLPFEDGVYRPHLTLSRLHRALNLSQACVQLKPPIFDFPVNRFHIYESLRSGTPTPYKILMSKDLTPARRSTTPRF